MGNITIILAYQGAMQKITQVLVHKRNLHFMVPLMLDIVIMNMYFLNNVSTRIELSLPQTGLSSTLLQRRANRSLI